jgi:hypothetical protein
VFFSFPDMFLDSMLPHPPSLKFLTSFISSKAFKTIYTPCHYMHACFWTLFFFLSGYVIHYVSRPPPPVPFFLHFCVGPSPNFKRNAWPWFREYPRCRTSSLMDSFLGECVPFKSFSFLFNRILKLAQHLILFNNEWHNSFLYNLTEQRLDTRSFRNNLKQFLRVILV